MYLIVESFPLTNLKKNVKKIQKLNPQDWQQFVCFDFTIAAMNIQLCYIIVETKYVAPGKNISRLRITTSSAGCL